MPPMARSSPQTERLVDTLELLAAVPTEGRTLAEIARHLGVDKATCYPMLTELTKLGWLVRHPRRKTFHLGPSLVTLGRAARTLEPGRQPASHPQRWHPVRGEQ